MDKHDPLDTQEHARIAAERGDKAALTRINEANDFKWLMSCPQGRRIVWRLLGSAGVFRSSFATNAMQMAFNEGKRNEGLELLAQIHTLCPERYQVMVEEQVSDRNNASDA